MIYYRNASMFLNDACTLLFMDLGQRISYAMKESGIDVRTAAKACDTSVQAIYSWMRGEVKDLRNSNLFTLADLTGFEARWIGTGEGAQKSTQGDKRISALVEIYQAADERGKATIFRVAEQE